MKPACWRHGDQPPAGRGGRWGVPGVRATRPAPAPSTPPALRCGCWCLPNHPDAFAATGCNPHTAPAAVSSSALVPQTGRHTPIADRQSAGLRTSRRQRCDAPRPPGRAHPRSAVKVPPARVSRSRDRRHGRPCLRWLRAIRSTTTRPRRPLANRNRLPRQVSPPAPGRPRSTGTPCAEIRGAPAHRPVPHRAHPYSASR